MTYLGAKHTSRKRALTSYIFGRYAVASGLVCTLFVLSTLAPGASANAVAGAITPSAPALARPDLMPLDPEVVQSYHARGIQVPYAGTEASFVAQPEMRVNRVAKPTRLNQTSATTLKALVILVQFTTAPPGGPAVRYTPGVFDSMLFDTTYIRGGADPTTNRTLKNFYHEVSYGSVDIVTLNLPSTVGWVTAPNTYTYYCQNDGSHNNGFGAYPRNVQRLVIDACTAADPFVDFSQYASGGVVENLFIVHSGSGAEWNSDPGLIWSHAWSLGSYAVTLDGVTIDGYSMEPECGGNTTGYGGTGVTGPFRPAVGVYAHEFGHVLGLPDEYDYGYQSQGTGYMSLMAGGSWSRYPNVYPENAGNSPSHPSGWGIAQLGFATPTTITANTIGITIPPIESTATGSLVKVTQWGTSGQEYWLLENRQQTGFDQGLGRMGAAAHGMVVYHVDENVMGRTFWRPNEAECVSGGVYVGKYNCKCGLLAPNGSNGEKWYGISVEQADGLYQMELNVNAGNTGDFFPGTTPKTTFDATSTPNTSSYYGCNRFAGFRNIAEAGGNITLDVTPDIYPPLVTVLAPNGGETWFPFSPRNITWTATDSTVVDSVSILLSTDGGATYPVTVAHGEANDGIYSWTVPNTPSTQCKIKVKAYDRALNIGEDASDAVFTIPALPDSIPPVVTVLAPNGGEIWTGGTVHAITWTATDATPGDTANVFIFLSTNGGVTYPDTVAKNEVNDGTYSWTVPNKPSTRCLIKVKAYDKASNIGEDVSNAVFTIRDGIAPVATVLVPNGGQTWMGGTTHSVTWTATDATPNDTLKIFIFLSTDGGATYPDTVAKNEANDGTFSWLVPDTSVSLCKIKVKAYDKALNFGEDVSDSLFAIEKAVGVMSKFDPIPTRFGFEKAYPNPFNHETIFRIAIPTDGDTRLVVFDTKGRLVRTILNQRVNPGWHNLAWNGKDDNGADLPAGVYLAKLQSGSFAGTKKVVLLK